MTEEQDDLTLVYMWAFKQGEKSAEKRVEELEAALILITQTAPFGEPQEIARKVLRRTNNGTAQ
jgi:hypothetical protein